MVTETQIYLFLKRFLPEKNWILVGGEPPDGTNSMPRIELKDEHNLSKGSKGSKKIDLLFFKAGYFLLLELKEKYNVSDVDKLNEIAHNEKWRKALIKALEEKKALESKGIKIEKSNYILSDKFLIKAIAYSEGKALPEGFVIFILNENNLKLNFGNEISDSVKRLF